MILLDGKEVEFKMFPNGETMVKEDSIVERIQIPNMIHFKYEDDSDLMKLMFTKRYLEQLNFNDVSLTIYYMPYSRMDRSENDSAFTLKYVADFINNLNFKKVIVIEPHSDVTCAVLNNSVPYYINFDLLPKVEEIVGFDPGKDFLFFPDAGAQKRYHSLNGYKQMVGYKKRNFVTGKIESLNIVGDITSLTIGSKVIIVDDLSSYGGTFVLSAEKLWELGFQETYLLVSHAENSIFKGKLLTSGLIKKVFTTDSILTDHENNWGTSLFKNKLHVFSLKELIL